MKEFRFDEATPLIEFIENNKHRIVGQTLQFFHNAFWPDLYRENVMSDEPIIIELDDYCLLINYLLLSDITFFIGSKEEIIQLYGAERIMTLRDKIHDFFDYGVRKDLIEGRKIIDIGVERFSHAFEYTIQGDERPDGGDYFSAVKFFLDSGLILCIRGDDAISDGYVRVWCE